MSVTSAHDPNAVNPNAEFLTSDLLRNESIEKASENEELTIIESPSSPYNISLDAEYAEEVVSFRDFFKKSFKRDTPPVHLERSILEKIRHTSF